MGAVVSWNEQPASDLVMWRSWRRQLADPDMEYASIVTPLPNRITENFVRYFKLFMDFQRFRDFVNPARENPKTFTTIVSTDGYLTTLALASGSPCLCLSLVYVTRCRLLNPYQTAGDKQIKSLDGVFHSYEWERATSLFCMLFGVEKLQAQLNGGTISFATRPTSISKSIYLTQSGCQI